MTDPIVVETWDDAIEIARIFAHQNDVNESRAEAIAGAWFEAGKDDAESSPEHLLAHLARRFQNK